MKKNVLLLTSALLIAVTAFAKTPITMGGKPPKGFKQQTSSGISFTENKGQVHDQNYNARPDVLYGVMTGNMAVHIKKSGVSYQLYRIDSYKEVEDAKTKQNRQQIEKQTIYRIDLNWINCNKNLTQTNDETLPGYDNYYLENCPNGALKVKSYKGITLSNLYNGINLHYYEKNGELKHDYIVAPNADYKQIQLEVKGADININNDGSLVLTTPLGKVQEGAPIVYQNGKQLTAYWEIKNNTLGFEIENYNPNYELVIDPVTRLWGTYYGGTSDDLGYSCASDASGNVYMAGQTTSNTGTVIATVGSHQSTYANPYDAFLVKFNNSGIRQWGTYYGGTGDDRGNSCSTDALNNIYLAGYTTSNTGTAMATTVSHQPSYGGGTYDAFLVKFDGDGIRQWGTYYGGPSDDKGLSCAVDGSGSVYLAGPTTSSNSISSLASHQSTYSGNSDCFLVKFNSSGIRQWATYYGGTSSESGGYCAVDGSGNAYLAGYANSTGLNVIATSGSHQPSFGGAFSDAFLVKFSSSGIRQWGTYYGGTGQDSGEGCVTDASGNVYLNGNTVSNTGTSIASIGSHQPTFGGGSGTDAFLVKFDATGTRLWGTYYGGTGTENGFSSITDALGNVYLSGSTTSTSGTIIATSGSHQSSLGGGTWDAYLIKFNSNGVRQWGTYYGGTGGEDSYSCNSDLIGNIYITGPTKSSAAIATSGSHQSTFGTGSLSDAFLVKFDVCEIAPAQPASISGAATVCTGVINTYSTALAYGANSYTWALPSGWLGSSSSNIISATPGSSGVFTLTAGNSCGISPQQTLNITVNPLPTVAVNSGSICDGESFTLTASGASSYTYSGGAVVSPNTTSAYTVTGINTFGCIDTELSTVTVIPLPTVSVNSGAICLGQSFTLVAGGASTYTYSGGPVVSPNITTSYSLTGTNAFGCLSSNTAVSTVTVSNIHPTITVNSGSICLGKLFTIIPAGANTYTIQGGASVVSPNSTTSYTVAGTSTAGCISSNTAVSTVTVNPLPNISVSTTSTLLCVGEEAILTADGGFTYTFSPGGAGTTIAVSPGVTSTYNVTGTDANGCVNTASIVQNVDACTGLVKNGAELSGVLIFPNPTNGIMNLEINSDSEISILNTIGQVIYSSYLSSGKHQINLEGLAKGMYFVKLNGSAKSIKLIKE